MQNDPILIHIPHSSVSIPTCEKRFFVKDDLSDELLRMTDLYTDELFDLDADRLVFPVSRLVCDVERFRDDAAEPMAAKGMGLAYTRCSDGTALRYVSPQKRAAIVRKYYDTHHRLFTEAVNEKLRTCGKSIIIDAHSFSAEPLPYENSSARPDFCIGIDPFHTPERLYRICENVLTERGFRVLRNEPFSGTIVPLTHLNKTANVSSIMIEINRGLYMTSDGKKSAGFEAVRLVIAEVIEAIKKDHF